MVVTAGRGRAQRGDGARLKGEIVEAATRLVDETGDPGAVSIRGLAGAVGVTPPALYLHFKDKDEILAAAARRRFSELDGELGELAAGGGDELETLARLARSYVRFGAEHRGLYEVLTRNAAGAAGAARPPGWDHLGTVVQRCVKAGVLEGDSEGLAALLWAALHGLVLATASLPELGDDATDRFLDVQIEGLLSI